MTIAEYENIRTYAQLKPDAASTKHLLAGQTSLPETGRGRPVTASNLHLTLIHFGKVFDVYDAIHQASNITYDAYALHLAEYIQRTEADMPT